jgi:hypothetical protein
MNNSRTLLSILLRAADSMPTGERVALLGRAINADGRRSRFFQLAWQRIRDDIPIVGPQAVADMLISLAGGWGAYDVRDVAAVVAALGAAGVPWESLRRLAHVYDDLSGPPLAEPFRAALVEECAKLGVPSPYADADDNAVAD